MAKAKVPMIYDPEIDAPRPVRQSDVDDFVGATLKMIGLRQEMLQLLCKYFPTIADDIALGSKKRGELSSAFWNEHKRFPLDNEHIKAALGRHN